MCLKIYEQDLARFFSTTGLAWQATLKANKAKLDLLTDIDILLMAGKRIRGGIFHTIHWYIKAINKYMKDYEKNEESSYLKNWDINNLYGWAMSQKLPLNGLKKQLNWLKVL